ncbi:formate dehydrogenase accessory protein FdhE [Chondromyces crocatus]|uniref:Formate dehydrogenase accessory protein FdhE n=1 Tax=Chondromyces crocatus TaxID=52 RepID=A0A0K1ELQ6_CHOCO|nr:formate dehydrogenase accessory protein FdhE [Chondromyces crocatus]AKT41751.1 uncharacterized protein CMC5_059620 [Chondromyces crocatus]
MSLSSAARTRITAISATAPELAPWLSIYEVVLAELAEPTWSAVTPESGGEGRRGLAPALAGVRIPVARAPLRRFWGRLCEAAARGASGGEGASGGALRALRDAARLEGTDLFALLEAAIDHEAPRLARSAASLGVSPAALGPVAQLAVMPLLQVCRRALEAAVATKPAPEREPGSASLNAPGTAVLEASAGTARGAHVLPHCPVCGAWPTLVEARGLARTRHLRCGRCGADWETPVLACALCGEQDHEKLVALQPEQGGGARKVDACLGCRGYLKSLTTLAAWPGEVVLLEDLATIDLDLVALDRGYVRPGDPGAAPGVTLVEAPEPRWSLRRFLA